MAYNKQSERNRVLKEEYNKAKHEAQIKRAAQDGKAAGMKPPIATQLVNAVVKGVKESPMKQQGIRHQHKQRPLRPRPRQEKPQPADEFQFKPFDMQMDFGFNKKK